MSAGTTNISTLPPIDGVFVGRHHRTADHRGNLTELWRASGSPQVAQWNVGVNRPGVIRGLNWHAQATDRITIVFGRLLLALADVRVGSPTEGTAALAWWDADDAVEVMIGPGILHGWWSPETSIHVYSIDQEWAPNDDGGVRFDDPDLDFPWPAAATSAPLISEGNAAYPLLRDAKLPLYESSSARRTVAKA